MTSGPINEVNEVTSFVVSNLCERVDPLKTDPHGRGREGEGEREGGEAVHLMVSARRFISCGQLVCSARWTFGGWR